MSLQDFAKFLAEQPLLALAMGAIFVHTLGAMLRRASPGFATFLRGAGNLGLVGALLLTIAQVARFTAGSDLALPQIGLPKQRIEGAETHIDMSQDGHFWVKATVNGEPRRFLVDTGATLTAISTSTAKAGGIGMQDMRPPVLLRTANGTVQADLTTIDEMRFGNIVARDLDAVVAPSLGETNIIGMNLLSRLAGWRVEGRTLILVPKHPQASTDGSAVTPESPD